MGCCPQTKGEQPAVSYRVRCHIADFTSIVQTACGLLWNAGGTFFMKNNIRKLALASILIALAIIFTRLLSMTFGNFLRIGLGDLPIIISGIILGPFLGAAVGAISDVLGFAIAPLGDFFIPGITLSAALWGFIPGVVVHHIFKKSNTWSIIVACVTCGLLLDIIMTPLWLSLAYGSLTYFAMLPVQAINAVTMMVVNILLTIVLIRALENSKIINVQI